MLLSAARPAPRTANALAPRLSVRAASTSQDETTLRAVPRSALEPSGNNPIQRAPAGSNQTSPSAGTGSHAGCGERQDCQIEKALAAALASVQTVFAELPSVASGLIPAQHVSKALDRHFHTQFGLGTDEIRDTFGAIELILKRPPEFVCDLAGTSKDCTQSSEGGVGAAVRKPGDQIVLCPTFLSMANLSGHCDVLAGILVHEAAHLLGGPFLVDVAQTTDAKYGALTLDEALGNAASFGAFAEEVGAAKCDTTCRTPAPGPFIEGE